MSTLNCYCVGWAVQDSEGLDVEMHRAYTSFIEALNWLRKNRQPGMRIWRETKEQVTLYTGY